MVVIALVLLALGALLAGLGVAFARSERRFDATAVLATATVVEMRQRAAGRTGGGLIWVPLLRFQTADGRTVDAEAGGGTNVKRWEPGQALEVRYHPADPTDVRVPGSGGGLITGAFIGIGAFFAVAGLLVSALAIAVG